MAKLAVVIAVVLLVCPAYAGDESETVIDLVTKAVELFQERGRDYAIKVLNASSGPFRKGSIYAFAVDFQGRNLSHPVQADLRGKDSWETQDAHGKFIIQDFIKIAKEQGQGWYEYSWLRVNEALPTPKKTYIKRVPGEDILVGCGYYVK